MELLVSLLFLMGAANVEAQDGKKGPEERAPRKQRPRVLLFAVGQTREYLFLRTLLVGEVKANRVELSICSQVDEGKADHGVEPERVLKDFPDKLGAKHDGKPFMSLSDYDVIVAFDPDWTKLTLKQRELLNAWVNQHSGGFIIVAGPVHSYRIARPGGEDLKAVQELYPVVLKDHRLQGLGLPGQEGNRNDPPRPRVLTFTPSAKELPFLKLDAALDGPTAGWNNFFWNKEKLAPEDDRDKPKRGFYACYPVEKVKAGAQVVATFAGPKQDQQPFIVTMPVGRGKSLYLGSGEFWRLRGYKESHYEAFWLGAIRHMAGPGALEKPKEEKKSADEQPIR
jgi:hypothetical protein